MRFGLEYSGLPIHLTINNYVIRWSLLPKLLRYIKNGEVQIDGWKFQIDYGLLYLFESKRWDYYIPPNGLRGKIILDVGGGCGETAKFFIENGAKEVIVIEANPICEQYLGYNSGEHKELSFIMGKFNCFSLESFDYDLLKLDVEGYEIELLPYLDDLNVDIVLESHNNYVTDRFLEHGFKLLSKYPRNRDIYGGVAVLCRWRK